jgi:hypothetical protein
MKKVFFFTLIVSLLVIAGCMSVPPGTGAVTATPVPAQPGRGTSDIALPMNTAVALGTDKNPITVSIYDIENSTPMGSGKHLITIYIAAKNTGTKPVEFVWFSKLTDLNGYYYGGIGLSHGGNGARAGPIKPNTTEAARDYVEIGSDVDLAMLSKGATLDVYFMDTTGLNITSPPLVPDYHVTWAIDQGIIR